MAQTVKCLPTVLENWVQFLGLEEAQEKEMVTHSSTLAWKIPWTGEPGTWGPKESDMTERLHFLSFLSFPGGSGVKNMPANAGDTGMIPGLGRKKLLGKGMATHSSILAW